MLKTIFGGIVVGMANIIPGVSGGTMLVIFGLFNPVMQAISELTSLKSKNKLDHIKFLVTLLVGVGIGLLIFSNIIEIAFLNVPVQTLYFFFGMIVFSVPILKRKEMANDSFKILPFLIGCALIFLMVFLAPQETDLVITQFPAIELSYLIKMIFLGIIAGGAMFMPGVSGSMLLLILGEYYLFNSLVANVTSFELVILIPLAFMAFGIALGILISSKLIGWALKASHANTMNFIMGLVIASCIMIVPLDAVYTMPIIFSSAFAAVLGGVFVTAIEKFVK